MKIKKAFTLAEILIVLMVIGALATMTIPTLMKGVTEAQYKTAYRKAVNAVINLTTMENLAGNLPARNTAPENIFKMLVKSFAVKGYYAASDTAASQGGINSGIIESVSDMAALTDTEVNSITTAAATTYWIVSEDNIAYKVSTGTATAACGTKSALLSAQGTATAAAASTGTVHGDNAAASSPCYIVWVDVNGRTSGPNTSVTGSNFVVSSATIPQVSFDTFPIYIAKDGATAGSPKTTITGRIFGDVK